MKKSFSVLLFCIFSAVLLIPFSSIAVPVNSGDNWMDWRYGKPGIGVVTNAYSKQAVNSITNSLFQNISASVASFLNTAMREYVKTNHTGDVSILGKLIHGINNAAKGDGAHSEGFSTSASGNFSHSEGSTTKASGIYSHAEGVGTTASGISSHAQGNITVASGENSFSSGNQSTASNKNSFVWSESEYGSHGDGTFNIKPYKGIYGFWIGDTNMATYFSMFAPKDGYTRLSENVKGISNSLNGAISSISSVSNALDGTVQAVRREMYGNIMSASNNISAIMQSTSNALSVAEKADVSKINANLYNASNALSSVDADNLFKLTKMINSASNSIAPTATNIAEYISGKSTNALYSKIYAENNAATNAVVNQINASFGNAVYISTNWSADAIRNLSSSIVQIEKDPVAAEVMNAHTNAVNPHHITASMIGAITSEKDTAALAKIVSVSNALSDAIRSMNAITNGMGSNITEEVNSAIAQTREVRDSLNSHISNSNNPHGVTAAQIGALTNEADPLFSEWIFPNRWLSMSNDFSFLLGSALKYGDSLKVYAVSKDFFAKIYDGKILKNSGTSYIATEYGQGGAAFLSISKDNLSTLTFSGAGGYYTATWSTTNSGWPRIYYPVASSSLAKGWCVIGSDIAPYSYQITSNDIENISQSIANTSVNQATSALVRVESDPVAVPMVNALKTDLNSVSSSVVTVNSSLQNYVKTNHTGDVKITGNIKTIGSFTSGDASNESTGINSHSEGWRSKAQGNESHSEGRNNVSSGMGSHAEGGYGMASGEYSHTEGISNIASGYYSHAGGNMSTASGEGAYAGGIASISSNSYSYVYNLYYEEDNNFDTIYYGSHGDGTYNINTVNGLYGFWIGNRSMGDYLYTSLNQATNALSTELYSAVNQITNSIVHNETDPVATEALKGYVKTDHTGNVKINGSLSNGEGSIATGVGAHSEGYGTSASGDYSHAEGNSTSASGAYSHAEGNGAISENDYTYVWSAYAGYKDHGPYSYSINPFDGADGFWIGDMSLAEYLAEKTGTDYVINVENELKKEIAYSTNTTPVVIYSENEKILNRIMKKRTGKFTLSFTDSGYKNYEVMNFSKQSVLPSKGVCSAGIYWFVYNSNSVPQSLIFYEGEDIKNPLYVYTNNLANGNYPKYCPFVDAYVDYEYTNIYVEVETVSKDELDSAISGVSGTIVNSTNALSNKLLQNISQNMANVSTSLNGLSNRIDTTDGNISTLNAKINSASNSLKGEISQNTSLINAITLSPSTNYTDLATNLLSKNLTDYIVTNFAKVDFTFNLAPATNYTYKSVYGEYTPLNAFFYTENENSMVITGLTEYGKSLQSFRIPEKIAGKRVDITNNNSVVSAYNPNSIFSKNVNSSIDISFDFVTNMNCSQYWFNRGYDYDYEASAFGKKIRNIEFKNLVSVGEYAFAKCTNMKNFVASNLKTVYGDAFMNCSSLTNIDARGLETANGTAAFYGCAGLRSVYFPNLVGITPYMFNECTSLKYAAFPNLTSFRNDGFTGCTLLETVYIPKCTTYAFGPIPSTVFTNIVVDECVSGMLNGISPNCLPAGAHIIAPAIYTNEYKKTYTSVVNGKSVININTVPISFEYRDAEPFKQIYHAIVGFSTIEYVDLKFAEGKAYSDAVSTSAKNDAISHSDSVAASNLTAAKNYALSQATSLSNTAYVNATNRAAVDANAKYTPMISNLGYASSNYTDVSISALSNNIDRTIVEKALPIGVAATNYTDGATNKVYSLLNASINSNALKVATLATNYTDSISERDMNAVSINLNTINTNLTDRIDKSKNDAKKYTIEQIIGSSQTIYQRMMTVTNGNVNIESDCTIYNSTPSEGTTYTFTFPEKQGIENYAMTFELNITYTNTSVAYQIGFPLNVRWIAGTPDLTGTNTTHMLIFRSIDGGTTWMGNKQGEM